MVVGSEDFSASFNKVFNTTILMSGMGVILYQENESSQYEIGCFVVNRKHYMRFRIIQSIMRGMVLAIVLMGVSYLWRWLIPGGAQFLDNSYAGSTAECCMACGLIVIWMNSISMLDSTRRKPTLATFVNTGKRNTTLASHYRPAASTGKRFLAGFVYCTIIFFGSIVFQIVIHDESIDDRMVGYMVISAICIVLWVISICFMRKKELRQQ